VTSPDLPLGRRVETLRLLTVISLLTVVLVFIVFEVLNLEPPESMRETIRRALRTPSTALLIFLALLAIEISSTLILFLSKSSFWIALGILLLFVGSILLMLTVISSIEIILKEVEAILRKLIEDILGHHP